MTSFVPALLIKLTLILSVGLVVAATLRSLSPSFRHLILYATLASCLALPFAMWMSPRWDVPVLPRSLSTAAPLQSGQASELTAGDRQSNPFIGSDALKRITNAPSSNSTANATVIDASAAQRTADTRGIFAALSLLPLLPLLWVVGFAAVVAWLAIGRFGLRRIAASAWPLDSSDWSAILNEERKYAGVDKPVRLYSSSAVSTPLTWGSRAPVVLLPEDALDWPEEHRRIVLRHELAHVARGDSFTQLIAGFVCALYWFHPLVWIAERRLRAECERACDDNVVSLGTPAAEYAAHLLEVARAARRFGAAGFLSVAMARPSQLEGRLLAVLNESRRRVSLSRGARPAAAFLTALVLIPLAAFRAVPRTNRQAGDGVASSAPKVSNELVASGTGVSTTLEPVASAWSGAWSTATSSSGETGLASGVQADTTLQMSVAARSAGTLTLDLKTGGNVVITGWDQPQIAVRALLRGRDWRETRVTLRTSDTGARLESDFAVRGNSQSTSHVFQINVPRNYNVRISSAGGSVSITGVEGKFTGQTGGGEINIQKAKGEVDIQTGGGDVHVSDSRLDGNVSTGGGVVRIEGNAGNLSGESGSGPVVYSRSGGTSISHENGVTVVGVGTGDDRVHVGIGSGKGSGSTSISTSGRGTGGSYSSSGSGSISTTSSYDDDGVGLGRGFAASGIRMNSAGGGLSLRAAPDGARVTTGGGPIRIGPSGGEVYASTGGGSIDIGPATGSVEAHTGAGDVAIELEGDGAHPVDVTSGKGRIVLVVPRDLNATLELETAYTNNLGHKTRIISDFPIQTTETPNWDDSHGTPRRYVRARQTVGRGGGVIRVRTVNGDIVLNYAGR
ncbi:MAG TPA: M56 family metallopeptidase [Gemmatimonadaceae bacterium]